VGEVNLLMVEDDAAIAHMYRLKLVDEGFRVRVATDGPSGLAAALRRPPDMLLLDIRLPGFDGFELLTRLRRAPAGAAVPVIVLSSDSEQDVARQGQGLGVALHLVKSETTPSILVSAIRRHLADATPPA